MDEEKTMKNQNSNWDIVEKKVKYLLDSFGIDHNTLFYDHSKINLQTKIEESMRYLKDAVKRQV